jgi:hypothetical protein
MISQSSKRRNQDMHWIWIRKGIAITALIAPLTFALPATASNSQAQARTLGGTGCTMSGLGYLCNHTHGKKTYVEWVVASLNVKSWTCNRQFLVWGTLSNGKAWSARGMSKCGALEVRKQFWIKKHFKKNTKLCVSARDSSVPKSHFEPYHACMKIK